ncbi:unnamed protein product [Ectocarpus fasciculatus]
MACRTAGHVHLTVNKRVPGRCGGPSPDAPPPHPKRMCWTRVPRPRARRATWDMRTTSQWRNPILALTDAEYLELDDSFRGSLDNVAWPRRLKTIDYSGWSGFNQAIELVKWPTSLQKLTLGERFNQPIEGVSWPDSLRELTFQWHFNLPNAGVSWLDSLEKLTLGREFNQPIKEICWWVSLRQLTVREEIEKFRRDYCRSAVGCWVQTDAS